MNIVCSDLEGILVPEIWINVAEKTGIEELRLTTRDIPDYNVLMKKRLAILDEKGLKITDIQEVIATMEPLEGALEFLNWLRSRTQIIVVSDTFVQFAGPLMEKLGWPTLFCNKLSIDSDGSIIDYNLRGDKDRATSLPLSHPYPNDDRTVSTANLGQCRILEAILHGIPGMNLDEGFG